MEADLDGGVNDHADDRSPGNSAVEPEYEYRRNA
jgi:hypothetical protein